jgi:glutaconate CoA-transferase subunit A
MRISSTADVIAVIEDGMTVAVGGSVNAGAPMALVSALIRKRVKGLTIVGGMTGTLAIDFLIAAGCVERVICPYVGNPEVAPVGPAYRFAARAGSIKISETDEGVHLVALRAAASGIPFGIWRASVGTSIASLNSGVELIETDGPAYLKVQSLDIDVALLWAPMGNRDGDIGWWRVSLGDIELANAAKYRVFQVDQVVSNDEVLTTSGRVSMAIADAITESHNGPYPFAGPKTDVDLNFLGKYASSKSLDDCRAFVELNFCGDIDE